MQASVGTFKSHEHYEKSKAKRTYFQQVTEAYSEFREYSPVVACNYDPASPSKKLTHSLIHFLADVDIATKAALETPELIRQWESLISGEQVAPEVAAFIIVRCARVYQARKLAPYLYFRTLKQPVARGAAA